MISIMTYLRMQFIYLQTLYLAVQTPNVLTFATVPTYIHHIQISNFCLSSFEISKSDLIVNLNFCFVWLCLELKGLPYLIGTIDSLKDDPLVLAPVLSSLEKLLDLGKRRMLEADADINVYAEQLEEYIHNYTKTFF